MNVGDSIGAYVVTAKLGEGGMGEVYRARDSRLKRDVALKVLPGGFSNDPDRLARFQREAELLASLNHPHIAHVHGLEGSGGTTALVMELVDGLDLSQRIAGGPLPVREALTIASQIASALEAAHDRDVIHRDLKPGNIRVRPDGTVKVLDFGLAKSSAEKEAPGATVTAVSSIGTVVGTPAYMSPEQARGDATAQETDIWAFGIVLYEMLTGISPFARPSGPETMALVLTATPDESKLPLDTPPSVRRLIRRCLEREPKQRWHHMGDARIVIEEALAGASDAPTPSTVIHKSSMSRRTALMYGAGALGLLAGSVGAGVALDRRLRPAIKPGFQRLTFRRGVVRSARCAPDGQTIYYGALWEGDPCRVHQVRIDGPESRAIDLPDANVLAISRSGEMAIALGSHQYGLITYGTLAQVPIAGGAPRQIVENVRFADWAPNGTDLAIIRYVDGRDRLEFPRGKVLFAPSDSEGTGLGFARVSPDGKRVAFVQYDSPAVLTGRVSVVDQSGVVTPLTPPYSNMHGLTWRGNEIVFTGGGPLFRSVRAVVPGEAPRVIAQIPSNVTVWDALPDGRLLIAQTDDRTITIARFQGEDGDRDLSWLDASRVHDLSADGKTILFTEFGLGGGSEFGVYIRGTDGSPAVRLGAGTGLGLSPDGRWAVSTSAGVPSKSLVLLPTGTGEARTLEPHGLEYYDARWLPDGNRFVVSARQPGHRPQLFLYVLDGGQPTALTPEGISNWALSTDGTTLAVRLSGERVRLYGLDGGAPRDIPGVTDFDWPTAWLSDGLLVVRPFDPASAFGDAYRVDLKTGAVERWQNLLPRDRAGIMAFQGLRITPDGRTQAIAWHRSLGNLYLADGLM